jgi:hypothetical protein
LSDGAFYGYIALLFASAVLLSVLAIRGFGQTTAARVIDGIAAVAFLGYGGYLLLFFGGGQVRIFFYAFIVPIFAVVKMVKERKARREAASQPVYPGQFGPQIPYGVPVQAPAVPGAPASGVPAQTPPAGYQAGYPAAPGYAAPGYAASPGYPAASPGYSADAPGYPAAAPGFPPPAPGYPAEAAGHPAGTAGYPQAPGGYPPPPAQH